MRALTALGVLAASVLLSVPTSSGRVAARPRAATEPKITGGFVHLLNASKYENWEAGAYPVEWRDVLLSMRDLGMDTVIVQRLEYRDGQGVTNRFFTPSGGKDTGPVEKILAAADQLQMKVFVGLWEDQSFADARLNAPYISDAIKANLRVAREAWPLYRNHASFVAWYLPMEPWNVSAKSDPALDAKVGELNRLLREIDAGLADLKPAAAGGPKLFAVAPYFNPDTKDFAPAERVGEIYTRILAGSGVDVLMLHDGIGVRGWETMRPALAPYFKAFGDACAASKVELWGNVEVFAAEGKEAAPIERVGAQIVAVAGADPRIAKLVAFDYFNHMNPRMRDCPGGVCRDRWGDRIALVDTPSRRSLYDGYRGWLACRDR